MPIRQYPVTECLEKNLMGGGRKESDGSLAKDEAQTCVPKLQHGHSNVYTVL